MNYAHLLSMIQVLPEGKQMEVLDFVEYLADKFARPAAPDVTAWTDREFSKLAMAQALRGMEDEPSLYTDADIKERWQ